MQKATFLLFLFFSFICTTFAGECVETEINFDFRAALPAQTTCPEKNNLERTPDPVIGGAPLQIKFGALIEKDKLPNLSKVLADSYFAAVDELNEISQTFGSNVRFSVEMENTRLNASYAVEKFNYLVNKRGANVILGPITSDELMIVAPTAKAAGITTVTATATSIGMGHVSNVFRMVPNDQDHANALAFHLIQTGFQHAVALYRGDSFGIPFRFKFQQAFQNLGGNLTYGVSYNPLGFNATDLALQLESTVTEALRYITAGPHRVAIVMIANEEWQDLVAPIRSPLLLRQFWAGSSGVSRVREPKPAALDFVRLTGSLVAAGIYIPESKLKAKVIKNLRKRGHNNPDPVAYLAYDSVILSGYTALVTRSTANPNFSTALSTIANYWVGSSARLKLNSVGDRLYLSFTIENLDLTTGRWKILGVFDAMALTWSSP
eukprot:TRINITY_DN1174_c0_g1_i1.p1 TRINITY_DN1174_c0_g1~~TRINITY_DN1174_c0_g1_i1.p1  ORF type:complete len:436 (-),score=175.28 TRINITY_DN1174_c0_g1_i1:186-1493(-)